MDIQASSLDLDHLEPLGLSSIVQDGPKIDDGTLFALQPINMKCAMKFPVNGAHAHTLAQGPPHWALYILEDTRSPTLQAAIDSAIATDALKTILCFPKNTENVSEVLDCTKEGYSSGIPFHLHAYSATIILFRLA
jgi:hypothetical protein